MKKFKIYYWIIYILLAIFTLYIFIKHEEKQEIKYYKQGVKDTIKRLNEIIDSTENAKKLKLYDK